MRRSIISAIAIIATAAGFAAPAANAGLLYTSAPSYCDTNAVQPFLPWGDDTLYVLTPGGGFEPNMPAWSLAGGARVVSGNEPFDVHATRDNFSLSLPSGSSASSPTMCFSPGDWTLRFFAVGSGTASVKVQIVVRNLLGGLLAVLDGGTVYPGSTWQPSPALDLTFSNLCDLLGTTRAISLRFTSTGSGSAQVDDVYLDPWASV
jgi:hypothetical protein